MQDNHKRFADKYFETLNASESAIYAGFSSESARQSGYQILQREDVQDYLSGLKKEYAEKSGITKERLIEEYKKIAFSDIRNLFTPDNSILDIRQIDDDTAAALCSVDVDEIRMGEMVIGNTKKIRLLNKLTALDALSKHLGLFEKDNTQKQPQVKIMNIDPLADDE